MPTSAQLLLLRGDQIEPYETNELCNFIFIYFIFNTVRNIIESKQALQNTTSSFLRLIIPVGCLPCFARPPLQPQGRKMYCIIQSVRCQSTAHMGRFQNVQTDQDSKCRHHITMAINDDSEHKVNLHLRHRRSLWTSGRLGATHRALYITYVSGAVVERESK